MNDSRASKPVLAVSLLLILCIGLAAAIRMAGSAPTYDGRGTDVAALQQDAHAYDDSNADGVAAVMVDENNEKTAADNVVYSVVFNYRGYDTLGESFILIGAIAGTTAILRKKGNRASAAIVGTRGDAGQEPLKVVSYRTDQKGRTKYRRKPVIVKCAADFLLPFATVYGWYIILHGAMSPGGGFQGGVLAAGTVLLVYLAYGLTGIRKVFHSHFLHYSETAAEIVYVCIGLAGIAAGLHFCFNFVFPAGREASAMLMNDAVGYHVMAGISCLLIMMLEALDTDDGSSREEKKS